MLLIENDINSRPFADAVLACLPPLPWSVSEQDLLQNNRQDLRHLRVFSVDPIGTWSLPLPLLYEGVMIKDFVLLTNDHFVL